MQRRQVFIGLTALTVLRPAFAQGSASAEADGPAIGRALQTINFAYSASIEDLPFIPLGGADYPAIVAHFTQWTQASQTLIENQRTALAAVPSLRGELDSVRRQALRAQRDAVRRLSEAYPLLADQVARHAAAGPEALERNAVWYRGAYFDASTLAVRVQRDMVVAHATLVEEPVLSAAFRVLGHSGLILLELLGIFRNSVSGTTVSSSRIPGTLTTASRDIRLGVGEVQTLAAVDGQSRDWVPFCEGELRIADAAEQLAQAMIQAFNRRGSQNLSEPVMQLNSRFAERAASTQRLEQTLTI